MGTENQDLLRSLDKKFDPDQDARFEEIPENPSFWWKLVNLDPVLVRGAVMSFAALAATLGLAVSDKALGAFLAAVFSLMLLVQALWTRGSVVPNAKVVVYKPDPVNAPFDLEPGPAISTDVVKVANVAADTPSGDRPQVQLPFPERVED